MIPGQSSWSAHFFLMFKALFFCAIKKNRYLSNILKKITNQILPYKKFKKSQRALLSPRRAPNNAPAPALNVVNNGETAASNFI
jgi:hypothetical protein